MVKYVTNYWHPSLCLQADLRKESVITGVATKGRGINDTKEEHNQWVTAYKLASVYSGEVTFYNRPLGGLVTTLLPAFTNIPCTWGAASILNVGSHV